jgi:hypothetical protein
MISWCGLWRELIQAAAPSSLRFKLGRLRVSLPAVRVGSAREGAWSGAFLPYGETDARRRDDPQGWPAGATDRWPGLMGPSRLTL